MRLHGLAYANPLGHGLDAAVSVVEDGAADAVPPRAELVHRLVQAEEPRERRLTARCRKLGLKDIGLRSRNLEQAFSPYRRMEFIVHFISLNRKQRETFRSSQLSRNSRDQLHKITRLG